MFDSNGLVIIVLDKVGDNVWVVLDGIKFDEGEYWVYLVGEFYVNVYIVEYKGGEICG